MAKWTGRDLVVLADLAGFSPARKTQGIGHDRWAAAIALAESGGNPKAHDTRPPDDSYGLMQINMIGKLGPARRKQFGIGSNEALYDPQANMQAAFIIYKGAGNSFRPWSTFPAKASLKLPQTTGVSDRDRKFFYEGRKDILKTMEKFGKIPEILGEGALAGLGKAAELGVATGQAALEFNPLDVVTDWLEGIGLRVAAFVGGGLLLIIALLMLMGKANPVTNVAKAVKPRAA